MRRRTKLQVKTSGGAGTSTGEAVTTEKIDGWLIGIHMDAPGAAPATMDMVVTEATNTAKQPILTKNNFNTDSWFYPSTPKHAAADGAVLAGQSQVVMVDDQLKVALSGANDDQYYDVTFL